MTSSLQDVLARIQQLAPASQSPAQTAPSSASPSGASFADALGAVTGGAAAPVDYSGEIEAAAQRYGVDPLLIQSVLTQESGGDPTATSGAGAEGLMQLMPQTAASLGVSDPYDPAQAIDGGTRLLRENLDAFDGNTALALAAYNAGPSAVSSYGGIPPYVETQSYVQQVLARYGQLQAEGA